MSGADIPCLKIFKYTFIGNRFSVDLPAGARPLSFQFQPSTHEFCVWILLDTAARVKRARHFRYFVTGMEEVEDVKEYIGTTQVHDGQFVAHCFEVNSP